ncbi:Adenylyltransferase and sulfurtransferase uba4 [Cercospora zeina]
MASMTELDDHVALLRKQIATTEAQLASLKHQLSQTEARASRTRLLNASYHGGFPAEWIGEISSVLTDEMLNSELYTPSVASGGSAEGIAMNIRQEAGIEGREFVTPEPASSGRWPLLSEEYKRYGRQMIMPEVGLHGQLLLKRARVLVVGVGGLGCPAASYLAGAGVGTLGLMDGDVVEISNLHRQIAHSATRVGMSKVDSAYDFLSELNPLVKYQRHHFHLTPEKAIYIFSQYDLVLDCTDHPTSRYLISDACVSTGRPLVSASALKTEGQLIVLNNPPRPPGDPAGGPCYRCVFPKPPPAESVLSCGEGGVLGPVVGVMGVLQALEAVKVLTTKPKVPPRPGSSPIDLAALMSLPPSPSLQPQEEPPRTTMTIFSAYSTPQFRSVRMRARRADCACCSTQAIVTRDSLNAGSLDYAAFCGLSSPIDILPPESRISASDFARLPRDGSNALIDVRDETQYQMCALRGSLNVPWKGSAQGWLEDAFQSGALPGPGGGSDYYVVCRYGNDSQLAVKAIRDLLQHSGTEVRVNVKDIKGGFRAWKQEVDREWPEY